MKLILHIGTEKTGTTSIQRSLAKDRDVLGTRGNLYPRLFGSENHMEIAVAAMDTNPGDELQMLELGRQACSHDEYRERLVKALTAELATGRFDRLIISNEHCHSRLRSPSMVGRLLGFFAPIADDIEVIVYLRRQDRLAVSLHSTVLKLGGAGAVFPAIWPSELPYYFDFQRMLGVYAAAAGRSKLTVRLYEAERLISGNVVEDFYATANLGLRPSSMPRLNTSLSAIQAAFLLRFNAIFPLVSNGQINKERGPIFAAIRNVGQGPPYRPAREEAIRFAAAFAEGNAAVRRDFFPELDRPTLFDGDFSGYPEVSNAELLTEDLLFQFIAAIWRFRQNAK